MEQDHTEGAGNLLLMVCLILACCNKFGFGFPPWHGVFGSLVASVSEGGLRVHYSHYEGAVFLYGDFACTTTSAH